MVSKLQLGKLGKLARIESNTQQIDVVKRHLGELDALEERVRDLTGSREGFNLVGLLNKIKGLEGAIQPLIQQVNALKNASMGIISSSSSPREEQAC